MKTEIPNLNLLDEVRENDFTSKNVFKSSVKANFTENTKSFEILNFNLDGTELKSAEQSFRLEVENQRLEVENQRLENSNQKLQNELIESRLEIAELKNKVTEKKQLELELDQAKDKIHALSLQFEKNQAELRSKLTEAKNEVSVSNTKYQELEMKLSLLTTELESTSASHAHEVEKLNFSISNKDQMIQSLQKTYQLQIENYKIEIQNLKQQQDQINAVYTIEQHRLIKEHQAVTSEYESRIAYLLNREDQIKKTGLEIKAKELKMTDLEKRLSAHNEMISAERSKFQRILQQLASEIQFAVTISPLNEYLAATERQITMIETELMKMPISSAQRPYLEKALDQLISQRDYIRDANRRSKKTLMAQFQKLNQLERTAFMTAQV